ncbi:MAG: hypothetical protein ACJ8AT_26500 [Hyalangium sp.]|uniref:hypothetical protein n=1 Tax=Hyalangium sp. TaxID=2028555 RepID=UPI00389ABD1F
MALSLAPSAGGLSQPRADQAAGPAEHARAHLLFRRYAGSLQLRLRAFEDLLTLTEVPEALWVATACPTAGLSCDPAFLAHLDTEAHGRVRARMFMKAIDWTALMLADRSDCVPGSDVLTLAHLSAEATHLRTAADEVFAACGLPPGAQVSLEQVRKAREKLFPPPEKPPPPTGVDLPPLPLVPGLPSGLSGAYPPISQSPLPLQQPPLPSALPTSPAPPAPLSEEEQRLVELERLILFQRWIFTFANNFVAMPDLYARDRRALFEQGTLIMAGREFSLAVRVMDRASHAAMASEASMFILYCVISGGQPARTFEVAVPVTSGTTRGLYVNKRGVFRDTEGREYDAQVVQIIQQPVSLYEATTAPLRRLIRLIFSRVESWSNTTDAQLQGRLSRTGAYPSPGPYSSSGSYPSSGAYPSSGTYPSAGPSYPSPGSSYPSPGSSYPSPGSSYPSPGSSYPSLGSSYPSYGSYPTAQFPPGGGGLLALQGTIGRIVGASVAAAAIGSALAFIINQLRSVTLLEVLFSLLIILASAMLPALLMAFIRIANRDLAVVLEGAGWAMNDRLRLTRRLGKLFTRRPRRPPHSRIDVRDKVAELLRQRIESEEGWVRILLKSLLGTLILLAATWLLWRFHAEIWAWVKQAMTSAPPPGAGPAK